MEKLFLIPQQGAVFLTLLGVGVALGAWWQLLAWARRRVPRLGLAWDALFALSLGIALLGTLLRWREEQLRLYALLGVLLGALFYLLGPGSAAIWLAERLCRKKHQENDAPWQEKTGKKAKHSIYNAEKTERPPVKGSQAVWVSPQPPTGKGEIADAGKGDALDEAGGDLRGSADGVFRSRAAGERPRGGASGTGGDAHQPA